MLLYKRPFRKEKEVVTFFNKSLKMELGYKFTTAKPDKKIEPANLTEQSAIV